MHNHAKSFLSFMAVKKGCRTKYPKIRFFSETSFQRLKDGIHDTGYILLFMQKFVYTYIERETFFDKIVTVLASKKISGFDISHCGSDVVHIDEW